MFSKEYIVVFAALIFLLQNGTCKVFNKPDSALNFTELSGKYGYSAEEHKTTTEDGYILTIFRIRGKKCEGKRPPLILMHGLLMSSDAFLDAGPKAGLAYLLADACQDLWVGNCRGNYYSRGHVTLNPDKDPEFWKFSADEMGYYDVPATIDCVLKQTGEEKLNYIGYSQGAGTVFMMCSGRPGYCDKVNLFIGLAPAARQTHTSSLFFRTICIVNDKQEKAISALGVHEVLGKEFRDVASVFCKLDDVATSLCLDFLWLLDNRHLNSISYLTVRTLYGHFTAGTSLQNMARYGQLMLVTEFQKFDFGKRNIDVYGSAYPPKYNLSAVTMPVVIIYGKNDGMVDTKDIDWLVPQLPNVLEAYLVEDPMWTHLDNAYSRFIPKSIFPKIYEYLSKFG